MSHASGATTTRSRSIPATETRLSGCWLTLARVAWLSVAVVMITSFLLTRPLAYAQVAQVCSGAACGGSLRPEDLPVLAAWGISPAFIAAYATVLVGLVDLVWIVMGLLLFARGSAEPRILLFSLFLLLFGGGPDPELAVVQPDWWLLVAADTFLTNSCLALFLFVFPTGQCVPRWTRWMVLVVILYDVLTSFFPNSPLIPDRWLGAASAPLGLALLGVLIGSQVYRYGWRSTSLERQQTKWVFLALFCFLLVDITRTQVLAGAATPLWMILVLATASQLAGLLIPLSIAAAILRYRLWEIDALINKVLVYGLLTALLGAVYAGLILGLESLTNAMTGGQAAEQPVVLVLSTLAIFALFVPVRRRIQSIIDRRFYRKKYDAEKTLAAFSVTVRNEVDLEHIRKQVIAVVQETMQPASVSFWLCQPTRRTAELPHRLGQKPLGVPVTVGARPAGEQPQRLAGVAAQVSGPMEADGGEEK